MTFYFCTVILIELLMIAMTLHVLYYIGFTKQQKTWFILTFISIMLCTGAEFIVHCGWYDPRYAVPLTVITVLQFSTAPVLAVFFSGALISERCCKAAIPPEEAFGVIESESGSHFDPDLVTVFLKYKEDFIPASGKTR
ncbi:MAG: hypothetical protein IJQ80_07700 [Clostridia bacterium]|nr:hypothetical protein [Clostridia bacterium]